MDLRAQVQMLRSVLRLTVPTGRTVHAKKKATHDEHSNEQFDKFVAIDPDGAISHLFVVVINTANIRPDMPEWFERLFL